MPVLQGNLKQTVVFDNSQSLPPPADLRAGFLLADLQRLACIQRGQSLVSSSTVLQRPRLGLSFLPVRRPDPANNALARQLTRLWEWHQAGQADLARRHQALRSPVITEPLARPEEQTGSTLTQQHGQGTWMCLVSSTAQLARKAARSPRQPACRCSRACRHPTQASTRCQKPPAWPRQRAARGEPAGSGQETSARTSVSER